MQYDNQGMIFTTNQLIVSCFNRCDEDNLYDMNSHLDVMQYIQPVKSRSESDAFLLNILRLYQEGSVIGHYKVALKETGHFIGSLSVLMMPDRSAYHIGYALMPPAQGKGLAKELLAGGLDWLVKNNERPIIYAITRPQNLPSIALLQKIGFQFLENIIDHGHELQVYTIPRSHLLQQAASAT